MDIESAWVPSGQGQMFAPVDTQIPQEGVVCLKERTWDQSAFLSCWFYLYIEPVRNSLVYL